MKKLFALLLALIFVFSLAACAAPADNSTPSEPSNTSDSNSSDVAEPTTPADTSDDGEIVIGFTISNNVEAFSRVMQDGIEAKAAEYGYSVDVVCADGDPAKQTSQVEDFITNGVDAIILGPCDSASCGTAIEAANSAGIPIFTIDIASDSASPVSHITSDNYAGGYGIGEWLVEQLDGAPGNVVILNDSKLDSVYSRAVGLEDAIKGHDNIKIIEDANVGYQRDIAMKTVEDFIVAYPEMNYLFSAQGRDAALAANDAIAAAGKTGEIKVISFDAMEDTLKLLYEGNSSIVCDAFNDAFGIGAGSVDALKIVLEGGEVDPITLIPVPVIDSKNVDEYWNNLYA